MTSFTFSRTCVNGRIVSTLRTIDSARTMLLCRSNAFTRASNFLLLRREMRI